MDKNKSSLAKWAKKKKKMRLHQQGLLRNWVIFINIRAARVETGHIIKKLMCFRLTWGVFDQRKCPRMGSATFQNIPRCCFVFVLKPWLTSQNVKAVTGRKETVTVGAGEPASTGTDKQSGSHLGNM